MRRHALAPLAALGAGEGLLLGGLAMWSTPLSLTVAGLQLIAFGLLKEAGDGE